MTGIAILLRVLHLGSAILLVGSFTFPILLTRAALRLGVQEQAQAMMPCDHLLFRLRFWSLIGFVGSAILGLWGQVAAVTNRPLFAAPPLVALGDLLTDTQYGRMWLLRLFLALLLGSVLYSPGGRGMAHRGGVCSALVRDWQAPCW
jgi:hypothetical protein